jgi:alkanesulfonate monooxygenase SsuD/methylene tetrahydromethanopterin reductase-like flavin-dependent oxidoreductase (luciferase family)
MQVIANANDRRGTLSVSWLNTTELAKHWAAHVSGSTHAGLRAREEDWRVARTIFICDDAARAEAIVKAEDSPCRAYYSEIAQENAAHGDVDTLLDDCVLFGTLQTVLDRLTDIAAASGPFGTLTLVDHAWADTELAKQSMGSLAAATAPIMQRNRATN